MEHKNDTAKAAEALAHVRKSQNKLAEKAGHCPLWRHAAFGALFCVLIGSTAMSSLALFMATPFVLLGVVLLMRWDRRHYGVFINGYRRGKTLRLTMALLGVLLALILSAFHMRTHGFSIASKISLAALAFSVPLGLSIAWHRIYRQELAGSGD